MKLSILVIMLVLVAPCMAMSHEDFGEFQKWLSEDQTDRNAYVNVTYDCLAFSTALTENATRSGHKDIYMANIQASQYPEGHWINAILMDDNYIFIEPQADILVELEGASITIIDDSMQGLKELTGKNKITVTGNMLIPVKA
jgi:hypothetical protein